MWIEEVTERQKSHSKQILQIYDRKTVLHFDFSHFDWPKLYKNKQKVDIKLSKICQNHQKLNKRLKFRLCKNVGKIWSY